MQRHSQISAASDRRPQQTASAVREAVGVRMVSSTPTGASVLPRGPQTRHRGLCSIGLPLLAFLCSLSSALAAMPHLDEVVSTKSAFTDDAKFGRDPFFPKSTRRVPVLVVAPISSTPDASAFNQVVGSVVLKGISGTRGKRLALLNNRTLEAGEEAQFKVNNQLVTVRCVEVREKSVVIGLAGTTETKEIHLRSGI